MQPYLLTVPLQRKEPEVHFDACQVDYVYTLSESEFRFFQHNLMEEQDFLRDYNLHHASPPAEGVRNAILVLSAGSDDGILACTEGYDYARYSAYVPKARQIMMLKDYPSLQDFGGEIVSVFKVIQELLAPANARGRNQFQMLMALLPDDHKAKWFAGAALNTSEQAMNSVMSTALSRLNAFLNTELEQLLCFDTLSRISSYQFAIMQPFRIFDVRPAKGELCSHRGLSSGSRVAPLNVSI